jgi:hypothetical protein
MIINRFVDSYTEFYLKPLLEDDDCFSLDQHSELYYYGEY